MSESTRDWERIINVSYKFVNLSLVILQQKIIIL